MTTPRQPGAARRKMRILLVAALVVAAGGGVWVWQRNTPASRVERLLGELRREEPSTIVEWLTEVGVMRPSRRGDAEIINDLVAIGPPAVEPLLAGLDDPVPDAAGGAAVALGRLGAADAVAPLLDKLSNPDWYLRYTAARALGELHPTEAVPGLIALLADADFRVADSAVTALASIGGPAVEALLAATGNANPQVRQWSAAVLGEIGAKRAAGALGDLAANDPDGEVRKAAARALQELRSPR